MKWLQELWKDARGNVVGPIILGIGTTVYLFLKGMMASAWAWLAIQPPLVLGLLGAVVVTAPAAVTFAVLWRRAVTKLKNIAYVVMPSSLAPMAMQAKASKQEEPVDFVDLVDLEVGFDPPVLDLVKELHDAGMTVAMRNVTLKPLERCRMLVTNCCEYSEAHQDFARSNDYPNHELFKPARVQPLKVSASAWLLACQQRNKLELHVGDVKHRYILRHAGIWRVDLMMLHGDDLANPASIYFEWTPGAGPKDVTERFKPRGK